MARYRIEVPEVHVITYYVEAASASQAVAQVECGEAEYEETSLRLLRQSEPSEWTVLPDDEDFDDDELDAAIAVDADEVPAFHSGRRAGRG